MRSRLAVALTRHRGARAQRRLMPKMGFAPTIVDNGASAVDVACSPTSGGAHAPPPLLLLLLLLPSGCR
jgi:hypothetical protein